MSTAVFWKEAAMSGETLLLGIGRRSLFAELLQIVHRGRLEPRIGDIVAMLPLWRFGRGNLKVPLSPFLANAIDIRAARIPEAVVLGTLSKASPTASSIVVPSTVNVVENRPPCR
jgi:hypothetical protein